MKIKSALRSPAVRTLKYLLKLLEENPQPFPTLEQKLSKIANFWPANNRAARIFLKEIRTADGGQIEALILDVDETLYLVEEFQLEGWEYALSHFVRHNHQVHSQDADQKLEELRNVVRRAFKRSYFKEMLQKLRLELLKEEWLPHDLYEQEGKWRNSGEKNEQEIARETSKALEERIVTWRLEHLKKRIDEVGARRLILPGVIDLLEECLQAGIKVGLYTNSPKAIAEPLLNYIFGAEWINRLIPVGHRVYGDEVETRKPDREGWDKCAAQMGVDPTRTAIGDDRSTAVERAIRPNCKPPFAFGFVVSGILADDEDERRINTDLGEGKVIDRYKVLKCIGELGVTR